MREFSTLIYKILMIPFVIMIAKVILKNIIDKIYTKLLRYNKKKYISYNEELRKKYKIKDVFISLDALTFVGIDKEFKSLKKLYDNYMERSIHMKILSRLRYSLFNLDCENTLWLLYCIVAWVLLTVDLGLFVCNYSDYLDELKFYDNGNYTTITKFENFKEFPNWEIDARYYCIQAEERNKTWFNMNTGKHIKFSWIIDESADNLKPINTNAMWKEFLSICENDKEVLK